MTSTAKQVLHIAPLRITIFEKKKRLLLADGLFAYVGHIEGLV